MPGTLWYNIYAMKENRKVYIKGMVCQRCITAVANGLEQAGVYPEKVQLGEVILAANTTLTDMRVLEEKLHPLGFSLLEDKNTRMVRKIKEVVATVYSGNFYFPYRFRFSAHLASVTGQPYDLLSTVFASVEKTTIEQYIISFRIQKIKELLVYTNESLADMSFRLGFSSVAHLSRQFKLKTGLTPSYFRQMRTLRDAATVHA